MSKTTDFSKVDKLMDKMMADGLNNLGQAIRKRAIVLAPKDSGDLRRSGAVSVSTSKDEAIISFGNSDVRYARRRHYENNMHPSTRYYLTNALKSISTPAQFFKRFF